MSYTVRARRSASSPANFARILGYAAFGEKGCAVKQFGGFGERGTLLTLV